MSLYDREYMRKGKGSAVQTGRRPGMTTSVRKSASHRLTRGEQVGLVIAAAAVIGLLLAVAIF